MSRRPLNDATGMLLDHSLVRRHGELLSVHQLVQDVVRLSLEPNQARSWAATASRAVNAVVPHGWEFADWPHCRPLLPHVLAVTEIALQPDAEPQVTARLLNASGAFLHATGQLAAAKPLYQRALASRERVLGPNHPDTATSLNNLASLLKRVTQGRQPIGITRSRGRRKRGPSKMVGFVSLGARSSLG